MTRIRGEVLEFIAKREEELEAELAELQQMRRRIFGMDQIMPTQQRAIPLEERTSLIDSLALSLKGDLYRDVWSVLRSCINAAHPATSRSITKTLTKMAPDLYQSGESTRNYVRKILKELREAEPQAKNGLRWTKQTRHKGKGHEYLYWVDK